jgi:polyhydroxyalkanoate synthesis regulator phasin
MTESPIVKRLLDAGAQFSEMSQKQAERLVNEFVKGGQVRRKDAEKTVQRLLERGRASTEQLVSVIQAEVAKQFARMAERLDSLEGRVDEVASSMGLASPRSIVRNRTTEPRPAAGPSGVAKVATRKAPAAKKSAAKKTPAKKSAPKKSVAKKTPAKKSAAKKSAAPS